MVAGSDWCSVVILEFGCIPGFWGFSNVQMHLYVEEDKSNEEKEDNLGFFFFFIKQHVQHDCFRLTEKKTVTV